MEFADFRAIRTEFGGTVNDVVLAIVTEAAARYLRHHGYSSSGQNLRLMCPVSVRREGESSALGNRVSGMFPTVPAAPMDPVDRLNLVKETTERIKQNQEPQGLELMMESGPALPPTMMVFSQFFGTPLDPTATLVSPFPPPRPIVPAPHYGYNFVVTNVPGMQVPQYLAGHKCLDQFGMLMLGGVLGYGVVAGSYNQRMYFSLTAEPRLMPDVDYMKGLVEEVFGELLARISQSARPAA
jgi:hypothetical protein